MRKNPTEVRNLLQRTSHDGGQLNATNASDEFRLAIKFHYPPKPFMLSVWPCLLILMLAFGVQSVSAQTVWSEGAYYPASTGGVPAVSQIPWSTLTHLDMVGADPTTGGNITYASGYAADATALVAAAHANGVKVMFELTSGDFNAAMSGTCSSGALQTFLGNITSAISTYGFDGVFVDYEETYSSEFSTFIPCLRTAVGTKLIAWYAGTTYQIGTFGAGNVPTCTGAVWPNGVGYTISTYVDRVVMQGYDLYNPGNSWNSYSWLDAALYSVSGKAAFSEDYALDVAVACGISPSKVSMSIPFYGAVYTNNTAPYQTIGSGASVTDTYYNVMAATYNLNTYTYDTTAHVPWETEGSGYITWENAQSITDKINYVYAKGMGGWMLWTLGMDYTSSASPQMPLLDAVGKAFARQPQPPLGLQIISVN